MISEWLSEHPGMWRPAIIARATGMTTHQAARALWALKEAGKVTREIPEGTRNGVYGIVAA
jgi:DNA-binding IclR family transcriptional regulator